MERSFLLQRGVIDMETGEFPLTLFTNGPASDSHIIHIAGLEVDDPLPMFVNHDADPTRQMGQLNSPHKVGKSTRLGGASLKMTGRLRMTGDGHAADIRRDVADGIHVGDISAMSGRWDPITAVPRASLKESHYAFSKIEGGWETPMFFEAARVLEGSIVGVPADSAAMIGRSRDLQKPEHVREFYDVLVHGDTLSRERVLEALHDTGSELDGWEEIECGDGKVMVPTEVARVWGQSVDPAGDVFDAEQAVRDYIDIQTSSQSVDETEEEDPNKPETVDVQARSETPELTVSDGITPELAEWMKQDDATRNVERRAWTAKRLAERLGLIQ